MKYYGQDPDDLHKCAKCGWLCHEADGSKNCTLEVDGFIQEAIQDVNDCEQWTSQYIHNQTRKR